MNFTKAKRIAERLELPNESIDGEERGVGGPIGFARAELVVDDDGPLVGERQQRLQGVTAGSRSAMQEHDRRSRGRPDAVVPDAATLDADESLVGACIRA